VLCAEYLAYIAENIYFFKFCLPDAETKTATQQQRTILPILPEEGTHIHTYTVLSFFLFFFFFLPSRAPHLFALQQPPVDYYPYATAAAAAAASAASVYYYLFSPVYHPPISPVSSLCLYTLDRILFLSPIADVGMYYALLLPDYRYFVYYLLSFLPSFLPLHRADPRLHTMMV
jgi:hypothetical protein